MSTKAKKKTEKKRPASRRRQATSPDTQERAVLMSALQDHVQQREGTQADKAAALGITQPRLNDLLKNRVEKFSLDALVSLASKAGLRVNVDVQSVRLRKIKPHLAQVRPIFAPTPEELGQLDSIQGTDVFLSLLRCETMAHGLSPKDVVLSRNIHRNDHGIDAKVVNSPTASSLLAKGNTYYQIKTGPSFKPWQPSALKEELFGKTKARQLKRLLGEEIKTCLDQGGTYALVTFGHDLTPAEHTKTSTLLIELFHDCGYTDPKVAVYGQGQLVGELEKYPSICLELTGLDDGGFLSISGWKNYAQMQVDLELGAEQQNFIKEIRTALQEDTVQHIRIIGEPGIGKTRLVLEAVSIDDIAPSVIYVSTGEDFQKSKLFNELLKPDMPHAVTLVIDDCDNRDRSSIWSALKGINGIKLISIDHSPEETYDSTMQIYHCSSLPDEQIKNILFNYLQQKADLTNWAEWCSGSPRVAHAVGENLKSNPDDLLKSPADVPIWDRFIIGHKEMDSRDADQHRIVLRHIALFQRFGFDAPVHEEAQFIADLAQQVDPLITWGRFQSIVQYYRKKRILQGRHTLFIVPKLLHVHLWVQYWVNHGGGFPFQRFLERVPESMRLWFLQLFIYTQEVKQAQFVVKDILSPTGPFSDPSFLKSDVGFRFLNVLAEADPPATLALLERTVKTWSQEELHAWETGRLDVMWALEKIAVWKDLYIPAVNILIPMALAENASNSNNSKGLLHNLFNLGLGWAPTQAPPSKRYPILHDLVMSKDASRRALGLELCKKWLETRGGSRVIGAEYQGLKPAIEFWRPETYGEVFEEWRRVLRLLHKEMKGFNVNDRNQVAEVIVHAASGFMHIEAMVDEILDILFALADDKTINRRSLTQFVIFQLRQVRDNLDKKILARLGKLDRKLTGTSLWERTNRYVLHTNWDEDYQFRNDEAKDLKLPNKRVRNLAKEYMQDLNVFAEYVPKLITEDGHRLHEFGEECGKLADTQFDDVLIQHIEAGHPNSNWLFMGGYFTGIRTHDAGRWETLLHRLLHNESTREIAVRCLWSSGFTESLIRDMLRFFKDGKIEARSFNRFNFRREEDILSDGLFQQVITALLAHGDDTSISMSTQLVQNYYFDEDRKGNLTHRDFPEELIFEVLTAKPSSDNHDQMYGFYWDSIARKFLNKHPNRKIDLFRDIMSDMGRISRYGSTDYIAKIADNIVEEFPQETWKIVSELMLSESKNRYELVFWLGDTGGFDDTSKHGAINKMPAKDIVTWIKADVEKRRWLIQEVLPKTLHPDDGGELTRLFIEKFCDDDQVAGSVCVHFHMGGWSGHESSYLSKKRDAARYWLSEIQSTKIQLWLVKYIDCLSNRIESCSIQEEREF